MSGTTTAADSEPELSCGVRGLVVADDDGRPANLVFVMTVAIEIVARVVLDGRSSAFALVALVPAAGSVVAAHASYVTGRRSVYGVAAALLNVLALGIAAAALADFWLMAGVLLPALFIGRLVASGSATPVVLAAALLFVLPALLWAPDGVDERQQVLAAGVVMVGVVSALFVRAWNEDIDRLARQRTVLDTVVGNVEVGLLLMDEEGTVLLSNSRLDELLELGDDGAAAGATGEPGGFFDEDGTTPLPRDRWPITRAVAGERFRRQLVWVGAEGEGRRAVSAAAHPVADSRGLDRGSLLVCHDLTQLLKAVRVKQDFVSMVSHELRTPLTSILGYLDLALEEVDAMPESVGDHLQVAERNAQRLLRLVTDLLSTASAEQGSLEMSVSPASLHDVVLETVMELRGFSEKHHVTVTSQVQEVPPVDIDVFRMGQVVGNLVSNAVKYSPPGSTVEVRLRAEAEEAVLEVQDHGIGMSDEETELAFSTFYRAKQVSDKAIQGVGLGLPITRTIVQRMGGSIALTSEPGQGTTATVTLPFSAAATDDDLTAVDGSASGVR